MVVGSLEERPTGDHPILRPCEGSSPDAPFSALPSGTMQDSPSPRPLADNPLGPAEDSLPPARRPWHLPQPSAILSVLDGLDEALDRVSRQSLLLHDIRIDDANLHESLGEAVLQRQELQDRLRLEVQQQAEEASERISQRGSGGSAAIESVAGGAEVVTAAAVTPEAPSPSEQDAVDEDEVDTLSYFPETPVEPPIALSTSVALPEEDVDSSGMLFASNVQVVEDLEASGFSDVLLATDSQALSEAENASTLPSEAENAISEESIEGHGTAQEEAEERR